MRKFRSLRSWLLGLVMLSLTAAAMAEVGIGISVRLGPPALPVYEQPICPGPNYLWTPGYWAYGDAGYYWVPGTWVLAPSPGLLWTPGYWGWGSGAYLWHAGYWGPHVGFYGGINYGFGYGGVGYGGGRWEGGVFRYNTAVTRINTTVIHNTYVDRTVVRNVGVNRVSYNGGQGGLRARASAGEESALRERRMAATSEQAQHEHSAAGNHAMLASENHGRPTIAATSRPGEFNRGVVAARPGNERVAAPRPGAGANQRNVPRPPSEQARTQQARAQTNRPANVNGAEHNAARPASRPASRPEAHPQEQRGGAQSHAQPEHRSGEQHEGGEHHDGGRPR
jgi:hypothetical protein